MGGLVKTSVADTSAVSMVPLVNGMLEVLGHSLERSVNC